MTGVPRPVGERAAVAARPSGAPQAAAPRRRALVAALDHVVPVPSQHQVWITPQEALDTLRCTAADLHALVDAGLASRSGMVERHDTWNTGLHEGASVTRPERELLVLAHMLASRSDDWVRPRRYAVTARARCPYGGCSPSARWTAPAMPTVLWSRHGTTPGAAQWQGEAVLQGRAATVADARVRDRWREVVGRYRYHVVPPALARQVPATRERGVGECEALARLLAEDLGAEDLPARVRAGHLLGGTRTRRHYWVEVPDTDGVTKVLDPGMAVLADRFFSPEYRAFCCGSLLNRVLPLADEEAVDVRHDDERGGGHGTVDVPLEITTRLLPG